MIKITNRVLKLLKPQERKWVVPLLLMMVVGAFIDSLSVTLIIPLVSGIMGAETGQGIRTKALNHALVAVLGQENTTLKVIWILIIVFIVKNAFILLQEYLQYSYTAGIRKRIQRLMMHYYMSKPYTFFLKADSGDIMRTVSVDSDHFFSVLNCVLQFYTGMIVSAAVTVLLLLISPKITMLLCVILLIEYFVIVKVIKPFLRKHGKKYREDLGKANEYLIESLSGIKSIKVHNSEAFFEKRYGAKADSLIDATKMERTFKSSPKLLIESVTIVSLLAFLLVQMGAGNDLMTMLPTASAFVVAATRILPSVSNASNAVSHIGFFESSLRVVEDICTECDGQESSMAIPVADESRLRFEHEIRLNDVRYSYPRGEKNILDHASLQIGKNTVIGIVGPSGTGKSTLMDILLGLLIPDEGNITLDGELANTSSATWKNLFAYIPQKLFIINGSVLENVAFGLDSKEADADKAWACLGKAQLRDFVDSLPDGIHTQIGEAGIRFSGGQLQRIAIARALYRDSQVLVFDESTSSLDYETEKSLMEAVYTLRQDHTVILVSHRLEILDSCDCVYCVKDGRIIAAEMNDKENNKESID